MWNLRQNLESSGHQEKYKSHTSVGRKFAPVEGLSHDLVCTGSIYHVHFAWQVWHGQLSPRFKFNKLKSFSGVEIDQNHVDKRILGGKGFAVGRLKRHNFCPASVLTIYLLPGTSKYVWKEMHCPSLSRPAVLVSSLKCCACVLLKTGNSSSVFLHDPMYCIFACMNGWFWGQISR